MAKETTVKKIFQVSVTTGTSASTSQRTVVHNVVETDFGAAEKRVINFYHETNERRASFRNIARIDDVTNSYGSFLID